MRKIFSFLIMLLTAAFTVFADVAPDKYFIKFTDKNNTPYTIDNPGAFLTPRAIHRRTVQGIAISEEDLPLNPDYVITIKNLGTIILTRSKWFNGITIYAPDPSVLAAISNLPFVQEIVKNNQNPPNSQPLHKDKFEMETNSLLPLNLLSPNNPVSVNNFTFNYGPSYTQIHMLNGDALHQGGYTGAGKVIAILDAGFLNADILSAFDSLRQNGQILGTKDFVTPGNNVYQEFYHGMAVLSTMGANLPGQLIGTAPGASYWLLRSEDAATENIIEEYNWVAAAEFADSVGADVINSSLGYSLFDDPAQNHSWADLTGNSTPVTRGANIAASKGIAVVNSAGNEALKPWHYISFPADGLQVLGIAAVDAAGIHASFSSIGFPSVTDPKPDIAAMGVGDIVANSDGSIGSGSGTSFSSPLIAGLVACLWEAKPAATNTQIFQSIRESASKFPQDDTLVGCGIPDFSKALTLLSIPTVQSCQSKVYPNPFKDYVTIRCFSASPQNIDISFYDITGRMTLHFPNLQSSAGENTFTISQIETLRQGCYFLKVTSSTCSETLQLIKVN